MSLDNICKGFGETLLEGNMMKDNWLRSHFISTGAIITGLMSDLLNARATSSVIMMYLAVPTVSDILHDRAINYYEYLHVLYSFLSTEHSAITLLEYP